jgi:uncharacterized membrane protein YebE (DUF533 family)
MATTVASWLGIPIAAAAPAWAVPVAVAGGAAALGAVGWKVYKKWIRK